MMAVRKKEKASTSAAPKYRAYKPVKMTDGLQTWTDHRFDMTQRFTADDMRAWRATADVGSPSTRIREMKARLDALDVNATPAIQLHAREIRDIHARLSIQAIAANAASREDLDLLKDADHLWLKIMELRDRVPLAKKGEMFRPKGRGMGQVTRYLREQRRPGETAKQLWNRLRDDLPESDEPPPVDFSSDGELVDRRTEKPITFAAFEKRLMGSKKA